ncbi:hypothetical protein DW886_19725 [Enterocloster aldenensis]|nr:hypothetical protein DW886_19725 [Enterocloster aldenensis]
MGAKYTAKWGVQTAGMNFQTRSRVCLQMAGMNSRHTSGSVWNSEYSLVLQDSTYIKRHI